jgi:ATP-dependent protease ClpP protease subunit
MADDTPRSAELEAAELRKTLAEARKAELEAEREALSLDEDRFHFARRRRKEIESDAYDEDQQFTFYFNVGVTSGSVEKCRARLKAWHQIDPDAPFEIVLNSGGGSVFDGFDLMDVIEEARDQGHRITTRIAGMAASMAGVIAQMGDERVIGRHSRIHLHEVSTGSLGKASDIKDTAELAESLTRQICQVYADRSAHTEAPSRMTADEVFNWIERQERWCTADDALDRGFVDRIA